MSTIRLNRLEEDIRRLLSLMSRVDKLESQMRFVQPEAQFVSDRKNPLKTLTSKVTDIQNTMERQTKSVIPKLQQNITDVKKAVSIASEAAQTAKNAADKAGETAVKAKELAGHLNTEVIPKMNVNIENIESLGKQLAEEVYPKLQEHIKKIDGNVTTITQVISNLQANIGTLKTRIEQSAGSLETRSSRIAKLLEIILRDINVLDTIMASSRTNLGKVIRCVMFMIGRPDPNLNEQGIDYGHGLFPAMRTLQNEIKDQFNEMSTFFSALNRELKKLPT